MLENHPGPKDLQNPGFTSRANSSLKRAMKLASSVTDLTGYGAALLAYTAGFRDGHFVVFPKHLNSSTPDVSWPGLMLAWRAKKVKVVHAEPEQNDLWNAELLSCDKKDVTKLITDNVFQFDPGKPDQESYWARRSHRLFLSSINPFIPRIEKCKFRKTTGEVVERKLNWRKAGKNVWALLAKATFGRRPEIGMKELRPGEFWINLPDFSPNEVGAKRNRALFSKITELQTELRTAKSIVIDMRGNQGGSSVWGSEMIQALWGDEYPKSRAVDHGTLIDWRLSKRNIAHMKFIIDYLIENGHKKSSVDAFRSIYDGAKKAFSEGYDFYTQRSDGKIREKAKVPNPVRAPIFFLTHGDCTSACLDFADALFELEGITHIGYPTGSDTNYMEVRMQTLPSGLGEMAIPTKVWRNRPRKSGAYYEPVHKYDGFDWSDQAVQTWAKGVTQSQSNSSE